MRYGMITETWAGVVNRVLANPVHVGLFLEKSSLPHPMSAGFVNSIGELKGQLADWRMPLADGRGIHVVEFQSYYDAHWDFKDPTVDPVGHLLNDAAHWLLLVGIVVALVFVGIGLYLTKSSKRRVR